MIEFTKYLFIQLLFAIIVLGTKRQCVRYEGKLLNVKQQLWQLRLKKVDGRGRYNALYCENKLLCEETCTESRKKALMETTSSRKQISNF